MENLAVDVSTASELIQKSVSHVRLEISRGNLKAKKSGRSVIILRSELERYLNDLPDRAAGEAPAAAIAARRVLNKAAE